MIAEILIVLLIVLGGFISAFLAVYGFTHRKAKGALSFSIYCLMITIWSFTYTFSILSLTPEEKFFWIIMRNIGLFGFPVAWLLFSLEYTGRKRWINKRYILLACVLPVLSLIVSATNDYHGLYYSSAVYERTGIFMNMDVTFGVWFWIQSFVSYLYVVVGFALIILTYLHASKLYRRQAVTIIAGVAFPLLLNILYVFLLEDVAPIDITPVGFCVSVILVSYGLFYGRTFDLIPIAHHVLVESMQDSLVVLDANQRIVDVNPAAEHLFDLPQRKMIGSDVRKIFSQYPDLKESFAQSRRDVRIDDRHFDMRVTRVFNDNESSIGKMILFRDISEEIKMLDEITRLATIDSLTSVNNRRSFFELAKKEFSRKSRDRYPLAMIMMDVDHFKQINDQYGHGAGDQLLSKVAKLLMENVRQYDIVGRYGGEEFLILMPSADQNCAQNIAERVCEKIKKSQLVYDKNEIHITVSMGVACVDSNDEEIDLDKLIMRADKALYAAKKDGRNQVVVWHGEMI